MFFYAGTEAGGHGNTHSTGLPLFSLLPILHHHLSTLPTPPLLLAAGGLSTGLHLLSVLPFSSGMVLGTAFLASPESFYTPERKRHILAAKGEDTLRTLVFDRIDGRDKLFGPGIDGRAIGNLTTREENEGVGHEELAERWNVAKDAGDPKLDRLVVWAGELPLLSFGWVILLISLLGVCRYRCWTCECGTACPRDRRDDRRGGITGPQNLFYSVKHRFM